MVAPVPVICFGLGPIGLRIAAAVLREPRLTLVGAVDVDPALVGQPLSRLIDGGPAHRVAASVDESRQRLADARSDPAHEQLTVLHATGSYLEHVADQLHELLGAGVHVVSTCEELAYPYVRAPELARALGDQARAADRTLVGIGINPGFAMDQLPISLAGACHDVRAVRVVRMQDPRRRRVPFQRKVGMNITREAWDRRSVSGHGFGHVGLIESGQLLAAGLGWVVGDWCDTLEPVQPDPAGLVLGIRQTLAGRTADGRTIHLHFEAQSGVEDDVDEVILDATPPLHLRFVGGVAGDEGTAAAVLRAARVIPSAPRGLITVLDLPLRARPFE